MGVPLAERMRPRTLDEIVGQPALVGEGSLLRRALDQGRVPSILLWGPPGTGKTTLAEALAHSVDARFERISAVLAGVKDIRAAIDAAKRARNEYGRATLLFVDEIHRFNKAQQDALLPHVEKGVITLIGATTENPSFEVNAALLSRCRVLTTSLLDEDAMHTLIDRALSLATRGLGHLDLSIDDDARGALVVASDGDARRLLTSLEVAADMALSERARAEHPADKREAPDDEAADDESTATSTCIRLPHVEQAVARRVVRFDKKGDAHYGVASALIKSLRGSDPDAALHYLVRMLDAGEDPRFILRRLVIFASEDIGCADPMALQVATSALQAFELVGLPEGAIPIAHAVCHLAGAPKSNAAYMALKKARADLDRHANAPVPLHLQNAATALMKEQGVGDGYRYPHDYPGAFVDDQYLPDALVGQVYYRPTDHGFERRIRDRLERLWPQRHPRANDEDAS